MLQHYKKQPQARPDVFRSVIIEQNPGDLAVSKTGDIIEYYNAVLIPAIKAFVLECAPDSLTPNVDHGVSACPALAQPRPCGQCVRGQGCPRLAHVSVAAPCTSA